MNLRTSSWILINKIRTINHHEKLLLLQRVSATTYITTVLSPIFYADSHGKSQENSNYYI